MNTASVGYLWNDNNIDEYSIDGSQGYIAEVHSGYLYLQGPRLCEKHLEFQYAIYHSFTGGRSGAWSLTAYRMGQMQF